MMDFNGRIAKNIGLYYTETSNFKASNWAMFINKMDEAWVVNDQSKEASLNSGVTTPLNVIPCCSDINKFQQSYKPLPLRETFKDKFIFYTVGEFNRRKNLAATLKAFHSEFHPDEDVELVIKTTPVGIKGVDTISNFCDDTKDNLKIYTSIDYYKKEKIIVDYWSENEMLRLHNSCDCFVSSSYGEAWGLPAFDAMAMGKAVICSDFAGYKSYLNKENAWLVPGVMEPVFGAKDSLANLFTGKEDWFSISISELKKAMREAYENDKLRKEKSLNGIKRAYDFSYNKIGNFMKDVLCHH